MSAYEPERPGPGIDRRTLLARALWGTAGAAAMTTGAVALAAPAAAAGSRRSAVFDVACLFNTFTVIAAPGATDPLSDFRGSTFFVEGELYPEGTIPAGVTDYDPGSATPIGHWLCRGWFINRTNRPGESDRPDPLIVSHQEYLLERMTADDYFPVDQLTSSGLEGDNHGRTATRSVVGGAGAYHGARGTVLQHVIGQNTTGGPNFRFEFALAKRN